MGSIIRFNGTIFYSLVYDNSRIGFNGLKYLYSVISVIDKRLPGNTKKWTLVRSWTARVRLVHSWAVCSREGGAVQHTTTATFTATTATSTATSAATTATTANTTANFTATTATSTAVFTATTATTVTTTAVSTTSSCAAGTHQLSL